MLYVWKHSALWGSCIDRGFLQEAAEILRHHGKRSHESDALPKGSKLRRLEHVRQASRSSEEIEQAGAKDGQVDECPESSDAESCSNAGNVEAGSQVPAMPALAESSSGDACSEVPPPLSPTKSAASDSGYSEVPPPLSPTKSVASSSGYSEVPPPPPSPTKSAASDSGCSQVPPPLSHSPASESGCSEVPPPQSPKAASESGCSEVPPPQSPKAASESGCSEVPPPLSPSESCCSDVGAPPESASSEAGCSEVPPPPSPEESCPEEPKLPSSPDTEAASDLDGPVHAAPSSPERGAESHGYFEDCVDELGQPLSPRSSASERGRRMLEEMTPFSAPHCSSSSDAESQSVQVPAVKPFAPQSSPEQRSTHVPTQPGSPDPAASEEAPSSPNSASSEAHVAAPPSSPHPEPHVPAHFSRSSPDCPEDDGSNANSTEAESEEDGETPGKPPAEANKQESKEHDAASADSIGSGAQDEGGSMSPVKKPVTKPETTSPKRTPESYHRKHDAKKAKAARALASPLPKNARCKPSSSSWQICSPPRDDDFDDEKKDLPRKNPKKGSLATLAVACIYNLLLR